MRKYASLTAALMVGAVIGRDQKKHHDSIVSSHGNKDMKNDFAINLERPIKIENHHYRDQTPSPSPPRIERQATPSADSSVSRADTRSISKKNDRRKPKRDRRQASESPNVKLIYIGNCPTHIYSLPHGFPFFCYDRVQNAKLLCFVTDMFAGTYRCQNQKVQVENVYRNGSPDDSHFTTVENDKRAESSATTDAMVEYHESPVTDMSSHY